MLHAQRGAATLLPLIRQYVVPGTTIVSDQWAAYSIIKDMAEGYQHEAVNYSLCILRQVLTETALILYGRN